MKNIPLSVLALMFLQFHTADAAQGEMGTGTPQYSIYGDVVGSYVRIASLANPTTTFPGDCSTIFLTSNTMGTEMFRAAIATIIAARVSGMRVRFYAHAPRDGGCGVDYVELVN